MLLLDTREIPHADQPEAFSAAMEGAATPCRIERRDPDDGLHVRMQVWAGARTTVMSTDATRFRLVRTPRHVRADGQPVIGLSYQAAGRAEFVQRDHQQLVSGPDLMLVDMGVPYSFGCRTGGGARVLLLTHEQLGLPQDVVRQASPRLRGSPLHDLVRRHLAEVIAAAPSLDGDPGAGALESATVELVRALLISAAGEERGRALVREQTLVTRVRAYVAQRLTDPELTPETIAAAHNVSVRQLYKSFATADTSLEQWVIGLRLDAARAHLTSATGRRRTIAAVARAHGFTDPSHFTRRFKTAYGLTPREWQHSHGDDLSSPRRGDLAR